MSRAINPCIIRGLISGSCPKCTMSFTGNFHSASNDRLAKVHVELTCNGCGHEGKYFFRWPDELPPVVLRHKSNGRALGGHRKKKKKKNPDGVLRGQMAFELMPDQDYVYKVGHGG